MYSNPAHLTNITDWLPAINRHNFEQTALSVFHYQYLQNGTYRAYVDALGKKPSDIKKTTDIPYLPISFFKSHTVLTGCSPADCSVIFESSGTTGMESSKHYVKNPILYRDSFLKTFENFYGAPESFIFLCLLPSYIERGNSSLVYMADELIRRSGHEKSGFYLNELEALIKILQEEKSRKIILLGVTFALLDFAVAFPADLSHVTVMETGGMKGRREEWTRQQVHDFLGEQWQLSSVHSEYGMTELLSQAYAPAGGIFRCPDFMKVLVRDENDPFDIRESGSGCLNIIDLANIYSCSFIATDDIGKIARDGSFEVLGRADNSALRGCSLMVV